MMRRWTRLIAAALLAGSGVAAKADEAAPAGAAVLRVCLDEDIPLYSVHHRGEAGKGFDVSVTQAVAARLGRKLEFQWFESKLDEDASTALAANALLSDHRCSLIGGYPLMEGMLGKTGWETGRMPDFDGAKPADRRRRVALGTLAPSKPYHFAALTVVLGPTAPDKPITGVRDLAGLKLGSESGSLPDAILMSWHDGALVDHIRHLRPGREPLLPQLEAGKFDAVLVDLRTEDAYHAEHPDSKLRASGWYHKIGFNMGFAALSTDQALLEQVDRAIDELAKAGKIADFAKEAGLTYLPPHEPAVMHNISMHDIRER